MAIHSGSSSLSFIFFKYIRSHCDDGYTGLILVWQVPDFLCCLIAVHFGHLNIHEYHIIGSRRHLFYPVYTLNAIFHTFCFKAETLEYCHCNLCIQIIVLCQMSAYARTSLTTLEHLLIPRGLKSSGLSADRALAGYGIVHGMALPVVLFPSCLLYALADLLVPELTTAQVSGRCGDIRRLVRTLLYRCLLFACGTAVLLLAFSGPLGRLIYHSDDAGRYIRLLAPLVPVMYLDTVTDGCLRGLGQQTRCMAINVLDATLGVVLVWALLPRFGLAGYLFVLYFNECVNFTLSFTLLLRTVRRCCTDEKPPAG